jgi:hypothetical protein
VPYACPEERVECARQTCRRYYRWLTLWRGACPGLDLPEAKTATEKCLAVVLNGRSRTTVQFRLLANPPFNVNSFDKERLEPALKRLSPELSSKAIDAAIEELTRDRSAMSLAAANREVYGLLKDGVRVSVPDLERGG